MGSGSGSGSGSGASGAASGAGSGAGSLDEQAARSSPEMTNGTSTRRMSPIMTDHLFRSNATEAGLQADLGVSGPYDPSKPKRPPLSISSVAASLTQPDSVQLPADEPSVLPPQVAPNSRSSGL